LPEKTIGESNGNPYLSGLMIGAVEMDLGIENE